MGLAPHWLQAFLPTATNALMQAAGAGAGAAAALGAGGDASLGVVASDFLGAVFEAAAEKVQAVNDVSKVRVTSSGRRKPRKNNSKKGKDKNPAYEEVSRHPEVNI